MLYEVITSIQMGLSRKGLALLKEQIGDGTVRPDYPLDKFLERMPTPRLPRHPLVTADPLHRLECAHGQSLPDWIRLRGGTLAHFPDGVARPETEVDIQALLRITSYNVCYTKLLRDAG